ncbi:MAG TPA: BamA/TamA family outer membrane protein [Gemmatimonadales bacterium]|nr:BamA/TamA family outer membrane protein [Gemmatimonadales bacterium]
MRAVPLFLLVAITAPAVAAAQDTAIVIHPESTATAGEQSELPIAVAEEAVRFYNAAGTARLSGQTSLPRGALWHGDVAVRNGPVEVRGKIEGSLLVINGDVVLDSAAEVTGDVFVVGGTVTGGAGATVGGKVRTYPSPLGYRLLGDQIVYTPNIRRFLPVFGAQKTWEAGATRSTLSIATGGTFNRVEGLPIILGPQVEWGLSPDLLLGVDAFGIFRTAGDLGAKNSDLGYLLRAQLSVGEDRHAGLAVRAFDQVDPVEDWGLHSAEVGWSAFLLHRDYRDYYLSKGIGAQIFVRPERPLTVSLDVSHDAESSIAARDPWTIFRNSETWRPNPPIDDGHYTTLATTLDYDSRNDRYDPTSGWYARAILDASWSSDVTPQNVPVSVRRPIPTDGSYHFTRLWLDLRRYTRVSAAGRVNLRLLAGGWFGGDPLPLQQRVSLGGADPLPGYGFRESACNRDLVDSAFVTAGPAACDRVILTQAEYRGHLSLHWIYNPEGDRRRTVPEALIALGGPDLVVFGDAGQAWLVGNGPGRIPHDRLPTIGSWIADLGLGVDWGGLGLYVAKAVTAGQPLRYSIRLDHRF